MVAVLISPPFNLFKRQGEAIVAEKYRTYFTSGAVGEAKLTEYLLRPERLDDRRIHPVDVRVAVARFAVALLELAVTPATGFPVFLRSPAGSEEEILAVGCADEVKAAA
jgi:hypothetical protein